VEAKMLSGNKSPFSRMLGFHTQLLRRVLLYGTDPDQHTDHLATNRYIQSIKLLEQHVFDLVLSMLSTPPISLSTRSAILSYLETLTMPFHSSAVESHPEFAKIPIILPSPQIVYMLVFDGSSCELSRISNVLTAYKECLEMRRRSANPPHQDTIALYNGYLMDICNLLWRSRAFRKEDNHAMGCLFPEAISPYLQEYLEKVDREYGLTYSFGISHHPALSLLSITALRELERQAEVRGETLRTRHAGPVTQRSLVKLDNDAGLQVSWRDYRVEVLEYLAGHALGGIRNLMISTMKDLSRT
jgi:centromere protein I